MENYVCFIVWGEAWGRAVVDWYQEFCFGFIKFDYSPELRGELGVER